ncbi:MAG: tRNA (N6-isopentenyl adenosine(37)-C2)-methylthiotransferase MiaB [Sumerlaeia bacterium]
MTTSAPSATKTFRIVTYGCQMNEHDSEIMAGLLQGRGYLPTDSDEADVLLFNTCTVRDGAEQRAYARINTLKYIKKPGSIIGVCGCAAQDQGLALLEKFPHVDLVVGTRDYVKIDSLIAEVERTNQRFVSVDDLDQPLSLPTLPARSSGLKAFVNIMFGCNNRCTFCIVPQTRGDEFSRPLPDIVQEVHELVAKGYKEVMLLGQNVNSYVDVARNDFSDLLHALNEITGLWRIRYTTSNPKSARTRHLSAISECDKVMENLHLPVQSGNDRILREMKRAYNIKRYHYLVEMYRDLVPSGSLSTDMIVGFPTETEEEFQDTLRLTEQVRFDQQFMFMYSPRKGTVAADHMRNDVPLEVRKDRVQRLINLQEEISLQLNEVEVGKVHEVLIESRSRRGNELYGRTRTDKPVVIPGDETLIGQLVHVEINKVLKNTLKGTLVSASVPV